MSDSRNGKALKKEKKSWVGKMVSALRRVVAGIVKKRPEAVDKEPFENKETPSESFEEPVFTEPELELAATSADDYEEERIEDLDLSSLSLEELLERVSATTPTSKRTRESDEAEKAGTGQSVEPVMESRQQEQTLPQQISPQKKWPQKTWRDDANSVTATTAQIHSGGVAQTVQNADSVQPLQSVQSASEEPAPSVQSAKNASEEPAPSLQSAQSVPVQTTQPVQTAHNAPTQPAPPAPPEQPALSDEHLVDLNNTTAEELSERLGLKVIDAQKAISVCEAIDGFTSLQQFCDALGFRPHVIERLRPLVKITPRRRKK